MMTNYDITEAVSGHSGWKQKNKHLFIDDKEDYKAIFSHPTEIVGRVETDDKNRQCLMIYYNEPDAIKFYLYQHEYGNGYLPDINDIYICDFVYEGDSKYPYGTIIKNICIIDEQLNTPEFHCILNPKELSHDLICKNNSIYYVHEILPIDNFLSKKVYEYYDIDIDGPVILISDNSNSHKLKRISLLPNVENRLAYKYFGLKAARILALGKNVIGERVEYVIDYNDEKRDAAINMHFETLNNVDRCDFEDDYHPTNDWKIVGFEEFEFLKDTSSDLEGMHFEVICGSNYLIIALCNELGTILTRYRLSGYSHITIGDVIQPEDFYLIRYKNKESGIEVLRGASKTKDPESMFLYKNSDEYYLKCRKHLDEIYDDPWDDDTGSNYDPYSGKGDDEDYREAFEDDPGAEWGIRD